MSERRVETYDTTLRDGSQKEGLSLTVADKLAIARLLDELGVTYIEGGWPGTNPKDDEFFERARDELTLEAATLVAFGSTRRAHVAPETDEQLIRIVKSGTSHACIVGKSWDYHVDEALRVSHDEAVKMVTDSIEFLAGHDMAVFFDAEHFFDGYNANAEFAMRVVRAAAEAGAERIVLCDTNGGNLPHRVAEITALAVEEFGPRVGVHFHDDAGCAVANALAAVAVGAVQVQGCVNGLGERTGNANLSTIIPNLQLKMGVEAILPDRLDRLYHVSHAIAEICNTPLDPQKPYVGGSAFAHKAGLHVSAIARRADAYEHVCPAAVGNVQRLLVSELAGASTVKLRAKAFGVDLDDRPEIAARILGEIKEREHHGFTYEAADGSFELLVREATGWRQRFFELESFRVLMEKQADGAVVTEATVKVRCDGERLITTAEGNGPVNALDLALRKAIGAAYPALEAIHLVNYKVHIVDPGHATAAITRVLIDSTDGEATWGTVGVHENIIEASWEALSDSLVLGLLKAQNG